MDTVGRTALSGGAAIAAGLALATKAAIDWESAWTGVAKVVDGTPEQMAALEAEIRGLTQILPQTHSEIAAVAAAAGQLGVKRQDIAEFTKVMVMMGTATNLSSEEAAFSLARMMNIMQTAPQDVGRLGSAIVNLGNNFATTEAEIVAMALRISGAGNTIGMTEADVLGFAAALSSVGIEAEAGGTAISTAFIKIESAVRNGGDELKTFASVSGMTVAEFKRAYEQDAARAIAQFVMGLDRVKQSGGDVFAVLESVSMSEIRMRDAMLRLAGAGDVLTQSLDISNEGWDENAALLEEAERRYGTTEAKMQIARNAVVDLAIDIGQTLLPVVGGLADGISALANFFGDLPGPVQAALTILGGLAAALLLIGGTALLAVPKIAAYRQAVETLANSQGRLATMTVAASGALGRVGSFLAGPWGIALGVAITALTAFGIAQGEAEVRAEDLMSTLDQQTGAITRTSRAWIANELEQRGAFELADRLGISYAELVDAVVAGGDAWDFANRKFAEWGIGADDSLARGEKLGAGLSELDSHVIVLNGDLTRAQEKWKAVNEATGEAEVHMEDLDPAARQLAEGLGLTADQAQTAAESIDDLDQEMKALLDRVFGLTNAQSDFEAALDDLTAAIQRQREANVEGAGGFDLSTEAGRENQRIVEDLISSLPELYAETLRQTGSTTDAAAAVANARARFEELAAQLGIDITQVQGYNTVVAEIERDIQVRMQADAAAAVAAAQGLVYWLNQIPKVVTSTVYVNPQYVGGGHTQYAHGGEVHGKPGTDNVPAMLTDEEFVMRAPAARMNLAALHAANAGAKLAVVGSDMGGGSSGMTNAGDTYVTNHITVAGLVELQEFVDWQDGLRNNSRRGVVVSG